MSTFTGTLTGDDGTTMTVTVVTGSTPTPAPSTVPTVVTVGAASHALAAVNPTGTDFPGGRGADQLVLYRSPVAVTTTNIYGTEVAVAATGAVSSIRDRLKGRITTGTTVPSGGFVLSGHGTARDWLNSNVRSTSTVTLSTPTPSTGRRIEEWAMQWAESTTPLLSALPATTNVVNLAFLQGNGVPVGRKTSKAEVVAFRARGGKVLAGIGGGGGSVDLSDPATFHANYQAYAASLGGLDGIVWDVEESFDAAAVLAVSRLVAADGGEVVFCPNGGNVGDYLPVAVALGDLTTAWGQQYYDAPVTLADVLSRVAESVAAGIPSARTTIGMMIADDANHWTLSQCRDVWAGVRAVYPDIAGAFLWEAGRAGGAEWSQAMA